MIPWPATVALIAPVAGRLADRHPAGILCGIGLAVLTSGFSLLAALPAQLRAAARLLGQTVGAALVALIFGFAGPSGGTGPTLAILLAAGFAAFAAVLSVLRVSRFVRFPRSLRQAGPATADEQKRQAAEN
jgi:MFS transporter, DHA2 family, multidrug resistance protein